MHHFGRVALVRGKSFAWGVSALVLAPGFLAFPLLVHRTGQTSPGCSDQLFSRIASELLWDFTRSFEAFCVGLAFHSYSKLWSERLRAWVIFGI